MGLVARCLGASELLGAPPPPEGHDIPRASPGSSGAPCPAPSLDPPWLLTGPRPCWTPTSCCLSLGFLCQVLFSFCVPGCPPALPSPEPISIREPGRLRSESPSHSAGVRCQSWRDGCSISACASGSPPPKSTSRASHGCLSHFVL